MVLRVLVDIDGSPRQRFLVKLCNKGLVREFKRLVNSKRYSQAMISALFNGKIEEELAYNNIMEADVDLIITKKSARWDLTNK